MNASTPPPLPSNPLPPVIVSLALGAIGGLVCWTMMPDNNLVYPPWPVAAVLAGLASGFAFPSGAWRWALLVTAGIAVGAFLGMIPGWVRDSSSNNLWPIVLGILVFLCVVPSFAGAYAGSLLRKLVPASTR